MGNATAALTEYRKAVAMNPEYNRAKRNVDRLEAELGDAAPAAPAPQPAPAAAAEEEAAPAPAPGAGSGELPPEVAAVKAEGNEFFKNKKVCDVIHFIHAFVGLRICVCPGFVVQGGGAGLRQGN